jgi:hypothetical protein
MSGLTGNNILGGASAQTSGYDISNSLMFDQNDTSKLNRTATSVGDRRTWTWSAWLKRGYLNPSNQHWFFSSADSSERQSMAFLVDQIYFEHTNGTSNAHLISNRFFRDVSAWYHVVVVWDTTQTTASDRVKIYVNGEQLAGFTGGSGGTGGYPSLNQEGEINNTSGVYIGSLNTYAGYYYEGYMSEVNFVDGQALTPSDFGETSASTNQWVAKKYVGAYGTNGFYLNFDDSSSIGNDSSGNGNNFTANNLVAADVKTDTPTNNFATLNPETPDVGTNSGAPTYTPAYRNGNLMITNPPSNSASTIVIPKTGKWYAEFKVTGTSGGPAAGIKNIDNLLEPSISPLFASYRIYAYTPNSAHVAGKDINNVDTALASLTFNGGGPYEWAFAYDADNGELKYYYNGTLVATESSVDTSYDYVFFIKNTWNTGGGTYYANFGQDSTMHGTITGGSYTDANGYGEFKYEPPADHLALCTANLPDPAIALPKEHFNTKLYTANQSTNAITGVGFQPDFTWIKNRTNAQNNALFDSVRGVNKQLRSDTDGAELTAYSDTLTSFDSDGFTLGADASVGDVNHSTGNSMVSWNWKAGGTAVSNTDGTITSSVSANPTAGFSIATYTGTGSADTIGHGLSKAPELAFFKKRASNGSDPARGWPTWADYFTDSGGYKYAMLLNQTNGEFAAFNNTQPTSSVYTLTAGYQEQNYSGDTYVAYFFHSVDGYSRVGFHRGNGSADGNYIYTNFSPECLLVKQINSTGNWIRWDVKRSEFNVMDDYLLANTTDIDRANSAVSVDFLSNGFKWRTSDNDMNGAGDTYIYLAFAESPSKYSNGR